VAEHRGLPYFRDDAPVAPRMKDRPARVVFGVPVRNGERWLVEALDSLLSQSSPAAGIVVVDDCSSDRTAEILSRYVDAGAIVSVRAEDHLGLVGAWRRAYEEARRWCPSAPYFAWGSDHDRWDPDWLASLEAVLDERPEVVLAYPLVQRIGEDGAALATRQHPFGTLELADPLGRLRATAKGVRPGDMIYGLYRVQALERTGGFPPTLLPDRLLLARLALEGRFAQVERVLWSRRYREGVRPTLSRQRRTLFPHRIAATYGPWWAWHVLWFFRSLPAEGEVGRIRAAVTHGLTAQRAVARQRRLGRRRRRRRASRARRARLAPVYRRLPAWLRRPGEPRGRD
jgi:glycosyltransferase involved in cell wall biosynthesis